MRIDELIRSLIERMMSAGGATHLVFTREEFEMVVSLLCHDPHLIDALGEMTERCFKAEGEVEQLRETVQQRFEERNGAREMARLFFPAYEAAEPEEAAFWKKHWGWLKPTAEPAAAPTEGEG